MQYIPGNMRGSSGAGGGGGGGAASPGGLLDYAGDMEAGQLSSSSIGSAPVTPSADPLPTASRRRAADFATATAALHMQAAMQAQQHMRHGAATSKLPFRHSQLQPEDRRHAAPRALPWTKAGLRARWRNTVAALRRTRPKRLLALLGAICCLALLRWQLRSNSPLKSPVLPAGPSSAALARARHSDTDPTLWRQDDVDDTQVAPLVFNGTAYRAPQLTQAGELPIQFPNPVYNLPRPSPDAVAAHVAAAAAVAGVPAVNNAASPARAPAKLTIFTTMRDLTFAYQRANTGEYIKTWNALRSWRRLGMPPSPTTKVSPGAAEAAATAAGWSPPDVILFVDHGPETCAHLQKEKLLDMRGLTCVSIPCSSTEFHKPLMHCLWNHALAHARTEHLAFVNGDIVLLDDYWRAFQSVALALPRFVMVAQRTDVPVMDWPRSKLSYFVNVITPDTDGDNPVAEGSKPGSRSLVYENPYHDPSWLSSFHTHVRTRGIRHPDSGIDMFTFHRSVLHRVEFPPFLVGVYRWDNWLLSELLLRSANAPWERTQGIKFDYARSGHDHGTGHRNESVESSSTSAGGFLVVDATHALALVHDSARSDHLHDPGALYNEELVKARTGLRYKVGRIGNADLVLRVAHTHAPDEVGSPHMHRVCGDGGDDCFLEWNAADRLDLHLVRQASAEGVVVVLTVSAPFVPLLRNFACWTWQRAQLRHALVIAEDVEGYRAVESWGIDVPLFLFPNATDLPRHRRSRQAEQDVVPEDDKASEDPASVARSSGAFSLWRLAFLARILDQGFSFLLADLDSFWLENPLPSLLHMSRTFQRREYESNKDVYQSEAEMEYGVDVPRCTLLGVSKRVQVRSAAVARAAAADDNDDQDVPSPDDEAEPSFDDVLSSTLLLVSPNKYSRYLWMKLASCVGHVFSSMPTLASRAKDKEPCRLIEERCMHDLVRTMHAELSGNDFQTCRLPGEFMLDASRLRVSSTSQTTVATEQQDDISAAVNRWTWSNDLSAELPLLRLSAQASVAASTAAALVADPPTPTSPVAPLKEVLGLSARSGSAYFFPKLLHDTSFPGATGVEAKVASWKAAGLWCAFKPALLRTPLELHPPPVTSTSDATPLTPAGGIFLRIHLHLSPSKSFTAHSFRAYLLDLSERSVLPVEDTLDIEIDVQEFRTPKQLRRDERRKKRVEGNAKEAEAAAAAAQAAGGDTATEDEETDASEPSEENLRSLTLSGVLQVFHAWKWNHGMKHVISAEEASAAPAVASGVPAAAVKGSVAAAGSTLTPHEQLASLTPTTPLRVSLHSASSSSWSIRYTYKEGSSASAAPGADAPILLLDPSVRLSREWFLFVKKQLLAYPKRHEEPSGVERRWFGLSLLPLVTRVGEMEPRLSDEALMNAPYPPQASMSVRMPRAQAEDIAATDELRLLGDDIEHASLARARMEALGMEGAGYISSALQRTQLINLRGLVVFSSSIHHLNSWKQAQIDAATLAAAAAPSSLKGPATPSAPGAAPSAASLAPCWTRPESTPPGRTHNPDMHALLRYIYATGSFVTAPAPHALGGARLARDTHSEEWSPQLWQAEGSRPSESDASLPTDEEIESHRAALDADDELSVDTLPFPAALAHVPLMDLSGAGVPLPDTLAYRPLLLQAAHHTPPTAAETSAPPAATTTTVPPPPLAPLCAWPAMHPKLANLFHVRLDATP